MKEPIGVIGSKMGWSSEMFCGLVWAFRRKFLPQSSRFKNMPYAAQLKWSVSKGGQRLIINEQ
jgi:hypothetical protein